MNDTCCLTLLEEKDMPNWCDLGDDYPSLSDVEKMEGEQRLRDAEYRREERKVESYLQKHPSSSQVEALYRMSEKQHTFKTVQTRLRKTCRICGKSGLYWGETENGWRLFESGRTTKHVCEEFPDK